MEKEAISRGKFLKDLGMSSAALMAFYCMGTVTSCKNDTKTDPSPTGTTTGTTTSGKIDVTLDLTSADYKKLATTGNYAYKDNIIIANAKGTYIALSKVCTHEGTTVDYRPSQNDIFCGNHGSLYNLDGSNKLGPAITPLKMYKTELQANNKLRIYE